MKKFLVSVLLLCFLSLSIVGCGDKKVINGVKYDTYGLANKDTKQNPNIEYEIIWGNFIWGCVLAETIIAPVYFFGWSLWEPIGVKPKIKGEVIEQHK